MTQKTIIKLFWLQKPASASFIEQTVKPPVVTLRYNKATIARWDKETQLVTLSATSKGARTLVNRLMEQIGCRPNLLKLGEGGVKTVMEWRAL